MLLQDSEITHVSDTIDLSAMPVEDSYTGPRMKGVCLCLQTALVSFLGVFFTISMVNCVARPVDIAS